MRNGFWNVSIYCGGEARGSTDMKVGVKSREFDQIVGHLKEISDDEKLRLIFMWVKQNHLSQSAFNALIREFHWGTNENENGKTTIL